MVTKFEKRIIAVLLAVIMCVPTAVLPTIQVKAESEKEAVSQNSIEKADLQQNAADHADVDNEDDGSTSGMENGIADNTGNAQDNTRKNDIGDGAFIPIEEETVDESNLAENAQESAVMRRTFKSLRILYIQRLITRSWKKSYLSRMGSL